MSKRHFDNWLKAYMEYTASLEAEDQFHFWSAVGTVAGALRGKCWIEQHHYSWFPNFFIILVGRAGFVNKSTSANVGRGLLAATNRVKFGPRSMTWQALVTFMSKLGEDFQYNGDFIHTTSLTCYAPELGTLIDPRNREQIDSLNDIWDGVRGNWDRLTQKRGQEDILNPWINVIGGTTPVWLQENFPPSMLYGGFASRCIFVWSSKKRHFVAYQSTSPEQVEFARRLVEDLTIISEITGPFTLTPEAFEWGAQWYNNFQANPPPHLRDQRMGAYVGRKQVHVHKVAMIISAAQRSDRLITLSDLQTAVALLESIERDMIRIFNFVGRSQFSVQMDYITNAIKTAGGQLSTVEAWQKVSRFMSFQEFELAVKGAIEMRAITMQPGDRAPILVCLEEEE